MRGSLGGRLLTLSPYANEIRGTGHRRGARGLATAGPSSPGARRQFDRRVGRRVQRRGRGSSRRARGRGRGAYAPDHAPVRGRAAYRATYAEDIRSTPRRSLSTRSLRVEQAGDLLVDTGEWQFVGNGSDGAAVHLNGSYVTVWKRLDGWRTVIDLSTRRAP